MFVEQQVKSNIFGVKQMKLMSSVRQREMDTYGRVSVDKLFWMVLHDFLFSRKRFVQ
jgi:hypothetical protein